MKKIYSLILLGLLLSVGNVWGTDVTFTAPTGWSGTAGAQTATSNGITIATSNGVGDTQYRSYKSSEFSVTSTVGNITSVVLTCTANGTTKYGPGCFVLKSGSAGSYTYETNGLTGTWTGDAATFTLVASTNQVRMTQIVVTYTPSATPSCAEPAITGETHFLESATVTISCSTDGASIYYTLDGTPPTESSSLYSAPFEISSNTTVKAFAVKTSYDNSTIAQKVFTKETIKTVAQALTAINALADNAIIEGQYVSGIVSQVDDFNNGSITYWISDNGTTSSQLEVYNGKGLNGANFSAASDLQLGDVVTVYGNLQKYVSGNVTTPEFQYNNKLVSYERPTPTITIASNSIEASAAGSDGTINVSYNRIDFTNLPEVVFYESDGITSATYDWVDAEINATTKNLDYIIAANTGAARTAYMKVYGLDASTNDIFSELITISQEAYAAPLSYVFYESFDKCDGTGGNDGSWSGSIASNNLSPDNNDWTVANASGADQCAKFGTGNKKGTAQTPELDHVGTLVVTFKAGAWNGNTEQTDLVLSVTGEGTTISATSVSMTKGAWSNYQVIINNAKANTQLTFAGKNASSSRFFLDEVKVMDIVNPTLGSNGYSTYAADYKYSVNGATVYKAALNGTGDAIVLTEVENPVVPAGEGIILKGTEGNLVTITPSDATASDFSGNELIGIVNSTAAEAGWYVLSTNAGITAFNPCQVGLWIPANKAYMVISNTQAPGAIRIVEETTDIKSIEASEKAVKFIENGKLYIQKDGVVYDVMGAIVR